MTVDESSSAAQLSLSGDWRIGRLDVHREQLLNSLRSAQGSVEIESADITHVDTLGLQLLGVFVQQCLRQQVAVRWQTLSPLLKDGAMRLGMNTILAIPAEASV
ncbi:STAS domain-containing protein [Frateuria aurantia]